MVMLMKRMTLFAVFALVMCLCVGTLAGCGGENDVVTLNVYNWGEYISDGSEDSYDVNAAFEEWFNENYAEEYGFSVKVNYTTYASNEDMYNKLRSGAATYDVIFPSDYMVERLINEGLLEPLNYDNIPNVEYIDPAYRDLFYDPENTYSVPYMFGMVGVIYNTNIVDEADVGSWDLMWNEAYKGKILQFNNPRDAFGTAMYALGIDVNSEEISDWEASLALLQKQKPLVQSYVMDEVFNKMKNGSAAIASYYTGDFLTMYESNDALAFYYPKEGTNVYVDAICIPTCCRNKDIAELYINFLCSEDAAVANAEYTYYGSPNLLVRENEEYIEVLSEVHPDAISLIYPDENHAVMSSYFHTLNDEMLDVQNDLWSQLKIESTQSAWIPIAAWGIVAVLVLYLGYGIVRKRIRESRY
ncbi:MAG: spermidine/putrescine ABC transporter substrate-binding protein [Clostridia bacterium]|nr:spermidine/putrescine ABC transporter substrate-binding protein [Clostridia bacterium]